MKKLTLISVVVLLVAFPAQAAAQAPTTDGYDNSSVTVVDPGDPADPVESGTGGALPFTGVDLALLGVIGTGLVALGFGMRRLTRRPDTA